MTWRTFLVFLIVFAAGVVVGQSFHWAGTETTPVVSDESQEPLPRAVPAARVAPAAEVQLPKGLTDDERRTIEIFQRASDATVFVTSVQFRRGYFSLNVTEVPKGSGTGFIWDREGHVVTNYHVIHGGDRFTVTLADGTAYDAKVIGASPDKDLAVLRIDAPDDVLKPLPLGESQYLAVGQKVLAVGNPFGLDQSLSVGVISALGRELTSPVGRTIRDVIQTDAAINPGNSGGPLLDSRGRVIGVNTAIISPSGASAGIGFAVPVDTARRLVPQLIRHGKPVQPGIGITPLSASVARRNGLRGVVIRDVSSGSPAENAGLKGLQMTRRGWIVEDQIVAAGDKPVETVLDLLDAYDEAGGVGATIELTVQNAGKKRKVDVVLTEVNR